MKEKLIKFWAEKYTLANNEKVSNARLTYMAQAYGALEFVVLEGALDYKEAEELCQLWDNEWARKFYEVV